MPVKVQEDEPYKHEGCQRQEKITESAELSGQAADERIGNSPETDEVDTHVDGDGVHADHDQRERPSLEACDIDDGIEHCQQQDHPDDHLGAINTQRAIADRAPVVAF